MSSVSAFPTSAVDQMDQGNPWTSPSNAEAQDGVFASCAVPMGLFSNQLTLGAFGFALPGGAVVSGFGVTIWRKVSNSGGGEAALDHSILLAVNGASGGSNLADTGTPWPITNTTNTYGGPTNLWGLTGVTAAGVNTAVFVDVTAVSDGTANATIYIDAVQVTVYYNAGQAASSILLTF